MMTLAEVLETLDLHARSSVVNVEPKTVAVWAHAIRASRSRIWFVAQQQTSEGVPLAAFNVVRREADDSGWEHHGRGGFDLGEALRVCNELNGVRM
jgi:hypothetical protein